MTTHSRAATRMTTTTTKATTMTMVQWSMMMLLLLCTICPYGCTVQARSLVGFYQWRSNGPLNGMGMANFTDKNEQQQVQQRVDVVHRTHHLPGSAMSVLVDAWFDVQEQQRQANMTTRTHAATATLATPTNGAASSRSSTTPKSSPHSHQQKQHVATTTTASMSSTTTPLLHARLEWQECNHHANQQNIPTPRIEILSRHAHDNTITFAIEQSSSLRFQQQCNYYHNNNNNYHHHYHFDTMDSSSSSPFSTPSDNNHQNIRWLATQFQNARGDWICATQETAMACRKRFIYTASCPAATAVNPTMTAASSVGATSFARIALYLADDSLVQSLRHQQQQQQQADLDSTFSSPETPSDTCTTIRNNVLSSSSTTTRQQQQRRGGVGAEPTRSTMIHDGTTTTTTCAFHFQLPCQPVVTSMTATSSSQSSSSQITPPMSAI